MVLSSGVLLLCFLNIHNLTGCFLFDPALVFILLLVLLLVLLLLDLVVV